MFRISLALLIVLALVPEALACTCAEPAAPKDALAQSTAVFTGKVTSATPVGNGFDCTIEVHAVWKGGLSRTVHLATDDPAMCGFWMQEGETYLFYALGEPSALETGNCTRSCAIEFAADDLSALGDPIAVPADVESFSALKDRYE